MSQVTSVNVEVFDHDESELTVTVRQQPTCERVQVQAEGRNFLTFYVSEDQAGRQFAQELVDAGTELLELYQERNRQELDEILEQEERERDQYEDSLVAQGEAAA